MAYQQQFTELLANAPPALDAVTAVAPELRQDLANTAALVQVLAAAEDRASHTLLTSGSTAFSAVDSLLTSQSANLGCFLHDTAAILSNLAQPTNLTNLSQGLAYNQYFFGAVDNIAVPGLAKPTTTGGRPTRTRSSCAPACSSRRPCPSGADLQLGQHHSRHPARGRVRDGVRQRCRAGHPGRLHAGRRRPCGCPHRRRGQRRAARRHRSEQPTAYRRPGQASGPCCWRVGSWSRCCSWPGAPGPRAAGQRRRA